MGLLSISPFAQAANYNWLNDPQAPYQPPYSRERPLLLPRSGVTQAAQLPALRAYNHAPVFDQPQPALAPQAPASPAQGYGMGWGDYQRRQQPAMQPQPVQYSAARPQALQLPSLTGAPNGQPMGPDPFGMAPIAPSISAPMKEGPTQDPNAPQGMWGRLNKGFGSLNENPLFNLGMSLLGNAQGSRWDQVGADMRQYGATQDERQRMANEERRLKMSDARDETVFGRQQNEWQRQDEQLGRWRAAMEAETDLQRRAQLEAIGPEGYGQYISQQQQMQFTHNENELNRANDRRVAATRSANENSLGRYFQAMDAQTIGDLNQQSAQLQSVGMPQLYALRDTINAAGLSLTGQPIDYNNRITLGRYFNGSSADRQTLEVWRAQILGPALETLRGLGAMSEREMDAAIQSFSNPDMTLGAAQQLIDQRIAIAQRRVQTANLANQYFQEYGGLTGSGPGWPTYLQEHLGAENSLPGPRNQPPGQQPPGQQPNAFQQPQQPTPQDIQTLRQNSSAERRRQFDEVYGPGAAARVLSTQVQGRGGASRPIW